MNYAWILIIGMYSPAGDFMGKETIGFDSKKTCESVKAQLPALDHPLKVRHKGICVSNEHYTGKKYTPGVALD